MKGFKTLAFLLLAVPLLGAQNKTYPTAATTKIRWDTYTDAINTVYNSTVTVEMSTWTMLSNRWTFLNPSSAVISGNVWGYDVDKSTYDVVLTTWSVPDFIALIQQDTKQKTIMSIANDDMEQYMIWPDTTTFPKPGEWKGWCLSIVNGHNVPIACPQ